MWTWVALEWGCAGVDVGSTRVGVCRCGCRCVSVEVCSCGSGYLEWGGDV